MMKISTKGRYGVRALAEIAKQHGSGCLGLEEIGRRQGISRRYLEHIFARLRRDKIVKSTRGAKGGYTLMRDPKDITIFEIVESLEGDLAPVACATNVVGCDREPDCPSFYLWKELYVMISDKLKAVSLYDISKNLNSEKCLEKKENNNG